MGKEIIEINLSHTATSGDDAPAGNSDAIARRSAERKAKWAKAEREGQSELHGALNDYAAAVKSDQRDKEQKRKQEEQDRASNRTNFRGGTEIIGGIGVAAIAAVVNRTQDAAATAAQYNGGVATAAALANVAQIQGDIRRSNKLGPALSDFVTAQSNFSQAAQDELAEIIRPLIPMLTTFLELGVTFIQSSAPYIDTYIRGIFDGLNVIIDFLNDVGDKLNLGLGHLAHVDFNTRPAAKNDNGEFVDMLLNLRSPALAGGDAAAAIRQPMGIRRGKDVLQRLGIPAFKGL